MVRRLVIAGTCCVALLAAAVAAPIARAQDALSQDASLSTEPLSLLDASFQPAPVQLVSDKPVVDEPAVPPGVEMPKSESAMLMALVAGLGGLVLGAIAGVGCCMFLFLTMYY